MKQKTLLSLLKEEGRTQVWLIQKLKEKGIERDKSTFSLYCSGHKAPRDKYLLDAIAEILDVDNEKIYECFKTFKLK